jgi:hypothetical protein
MSRHYHATTRHGEETFERRRHAAAMAQGIVLICDNPGHAIEVRACRNCGEAVAFVAAGGALGQYRCPAGCTERWLQLY